MSDLSDYELDTLLADAQELDRQRLSDPIAPRLARLLAENRTLREQQAEREYLSHLETTGG